MTSESIGRILASYERMAPRADDMVAGFYQRLFAACPQARALFKSDMTIQRQHLAATLALLVRNLAFQDLLEEPLMGLGAQHVTFGARPEFYPVVQESLLTAISEALGEHWTPELQADWTSLLDHIVAVMLKGATLFALETARDALRKASRGGQ